MDNLPLPPVNPHGDQNQPASQPSGIFGRFQVAMRAIRGFAGDIMRAG